MASNKIVNQHCCGFCNSKTNLFNKTIDRNRGCSNVIFQNNRCPNCGLISLVNAPADLARYYTSDYHRHPSSEEELEPDLAYQQYKIDLVTKYCNSGSLLEIGPSVGLFSLLAKRHGFNVSLIEQDEECVEFLSKKLGLRTVQSNNPVVVMKEENRKYDAICMWHSLEHMPNPWSVIETAAQHLNNDGVFVIACPNPGSFQAKIMRRRWPHWDLPRHLFSMPIKWITQRGAAAGLRTELATTRDFGSLDLNRIGWSMYMMNFVKGQSLRKKFSYAGLLIARGLQSIEGREGRGACYCIVLRKS